MGDVFRKVRSGQPLRIPAAAYNAFVDAAVDLRGRERNSNAGSALEPAQRGIVLVRNDSDDDIEPYHALAITGGLVQPDNTTGCHLAWRAQNRAPVDAIYAAALAAGGKDNGAPGLRPDYHAHYYGAFVIDPEGNNIEAVCHLPE